LRLSTASSAVSLATVLALVIFTSFSETTVPASDKHKNGIYHINNVNNYHSGLKDFVRQFKGISTKYLDNYLNWFSWIRKGGDNNLLVKECLLGC